MDRESPELIEQEMQQTRASLTEKVSALECQVLGTIQNATEAVHSTVESVKAAVQDVSSTVKDTVSESVHTVKEQVSSTLDVKRHTRENPWAMVGGAAAVGFVTGYFLFGPRGEHSRAARRAIGGSFEGLSEASRPTSTPAPAYRTQSYQPQQFSAPRRPSWLDELFDRVGEEAKKLGEMALASATASLRQAVQQQVPKLIEEKIPKLIEDGIPKLIDRVQTSSSGMVSASGATCPSETESSYSHPGSFQGSPYPRPTSGERMPPGGPTI